MGRMFGDKMRKDVRETIEKYASRKIDIGVTTYFRLHYDWNRDEIWALVIGMGEGFEQVDKNNPYDFGDMRICGKIAYQPANSWMKEYDIDWLMPYDDETGFVDDTECSIENEGAIDLCIEFWEEEWNRIFSELK